MNTFEAVGQFHYKFGLPIARDTAPGFPDEGVIRFRMAFLLEELSEFAEACGMIRLSLQLKSMQQLIHQYAVDPTNQNLEAGADALADLKYVLDGTAHMFGIPLNEVFAEVQRANMTKVRASSADDERSVRKHSLDVVKPRDFVAPNHAPILERHAARFRVGE